MKSNETKSRTESGATSAGSKTPGRSPWAHLRAFLGKQARAHAAAVSADLQATSPAERRMGATASLRELGVPGPLADEMEFVIGMMHQGEAGRLLDYTFCTPDGVLHRLRGHAEDEATNRAA